MSIDNTNSANGYYKLVNELVDDYIEKWKIRPSNLKKYLKPGSQRFSKFIERNKLADIKGIERVVTDVIDDRYHMERDGVLKFEAYKYFESNEFKIDSLKRCLYKGIEKSTINMEKILADYFDANLGDIDIVDADKHIFKLSNWENKDWKIVIYTDEELDVILTNIIEFLYEELSKKKIELSEHISIELSDLINKENFSTKIENILTDELAKKLISDCLDDGFKFKSEFKKHYIWVS